MDGQGPSASPTPAKHESSPVRQPRLQYDNNNLDGQFDKEPDGDYDDDDDDDDDDDAEPLPSDWSSDQQEESSDEEEQAVWMDDELEERTCRRSQSKHSSARSDSLALAPTTDELIARLAQQLEIWESPDHLARHYPPNLRSGFHMPNLSEANILAELIALRDYDLEISDETFNKIDLEAFCVYRAPGHRHSQGKFDYLSVMASELHPRELYATGQAEPCWLMNGTLACKSESQEIVATEIVAIEIGGLGNLQPYSVDRPIWIMTRESQKRDYWYHLRTPSEAYLPYWTPFTWLADFAKFFLDFLHIHSFDAGTSVNLSRFRSQFWTWIHNLHGTKVEQWHAQCGNRTDFRQDVLSHALFLYEQASTHSHHGTRMSHPIWTEIGAVQVSRASQALSRWKKTLVTSNVARSFSLFKPWLKHDVLKVVQLCPQAKAYQQKMIHKWGFPTKSGVDLDATFVTMDDGSAVSKAAWILEEAGESNQSVRVSHPGELLRKVVVIRSQNGGRCHGQEEFDYAWVKRVNTDKTISVIWLVLPGDTICGSEDDAAVSYPVGNELFFSDRCNCAEIRVENVVRIVETSMFQGHAVLGAEFFVHSLYIEKEEAIACLTESELLSRPCSLHNGRKTPQPSRQFVQRGTKPRLRGLSLFSGCGLLDHAFTSTGSSEIVYGVEHCEIAARSYKANDDTDSAHVEIGAVEDALAGFASGRKAMPEMDFVIGGFPCPYYSSANSFRDSAKGHKDGSLVANMLSWIDMFMPPYVLMENVPNMDQIQPNACRQTICHLVALGYQVRKSTHVDARLGGASIRERLFIVAAAPGVVLPDRLVDTHGTAGQRKIRTVAETIGDLEGSINNETGINIKDPSHVPLHRLCVDFARQVSYLALVTQIPIEPTGMSLSRTYHDGGLLPHQRRFFEEEIHVEKQARGSKCLKRVDPEVPFKTVCTLSSPMDARVSGNIIHPSERRTLSLKEGGRRAMGVPDRFLLAGSVEEQYRQCGNGVPWAMGAAWGRSFGRAWFASLERRAKAQYGNESESESASASASADAGIVKVEDKEGDSRPSARREETQGTPQKRRVGSLLPRDEDGGHGNDDNDNANESDSDDDSDSSVEFLEVRPVKKHRVD